MPSTRQLNKIAVKFSSCKSHVENTNRKSEIRYLYLRYPPTFAILCELIEIFVLRLKQLQVQGIKYCDLPNHFGTLKQELLQREKDLRWFADFDTFNSSDTQSELDERKISDARYSVKYFGTPRRRKSRWRVKIYNNLNFRIRKNGK